MMRALSTTVSPLSLPSAAAAVAVLALGLAATPAKSQTADDILNLFSAAGKAIEAGEEFGPADEFYIGRRISARLVGDKRVLPPEDIRSRYVRSVGVSLALASNAPYLFDGYTFLVIDDNQINAFATPGGFVMITTGMLNFLQDEDELAAILGHEIGHVEMEHGMIAVRQARSSSATQGLLSAGASIGLAQAGVDGAAAISGLTDAMLDGVFDAVKNGYSADIEGESDTRGMAISAQLGYDPYAMLDILERFKTRKGSYGGAGYPTERGNLARQFLQQQGLQRGERNPVRARRYNTFAKAGG